MLVVRFVVGILSTGMVLGPGEIFSQDYPNKPLRLVTSAAGGGSDFMARLIAQGIAAPLGQPVIVDNRPTGVIPAGIVAKALPDGYTLLLSGSNFYIVTLLQETAYDPVKDFSPITSIDKTPDILVVHPAVPIKSVKELIALAKAKPGVLNYASGPAGGPIHLSGELLKSMAGVNIVRIPYKGGGPALNGLLSGDAQLSFISPSSAMPHVKSGKLSALAVTSTQTSVLVPGLPTIAASLPGFENVSMTGLFAPAKTPTAIIDRLNREILRFLKTNEAIERFFNAGIEAISSSPEQLAATMKSDMSRMGKVIKDAGIKAD